MDYSPLIMEIDEEVLVKEERRPEAIPAAVPPPIFLQWRPAASLFWCFRSTPPSLHETRRGPLYMGVLGQGDLLGLLMDGR